MLRKFLKEYTVKSYEADAHGFLRIMALMNILQDAADGSAMELGFGFEDCWKRGVSWVGSNYLIKSTGYRKFMNSLLLKHGRLRPNFGAQFVILSLRMKTATN